MKRCYCLLMLLLFLTLMSFSQTDLENRNFLSFEGETFVSVTSGENLTINYEIPVELLDQNPMIGIFKAGSDFDSSHVLKNTMIFDAVGKTLFYSPEDEGQYIVCIYNQDEKLSDPITFEVAKKELEVTEETQVETEVSTDLSQLNTTLEIETEAVFPDELLTVHYYEAPGFETDWIGIYEVGDTEGYIIDWQYTDGSENGSLKFNAPYEPGNYIFRFFPDDTFDIIAESEPFAVLDVETTNPEDIDEKVMVRESVFCETVEEDLPVNEKTDFTYSNEYVYLWLMLGSFKGAHEGRWEWYYPDGELYDTVYLDIPSAYERGMEHWDSLSLWSWIPVKEETEKQAGIWKVFFYIDDELVLARQFIITEALKSKRPVIETTEKNIQIGELSLTVPANSEWFEDSEYKDLYYINLDPEKDLYPLIGIEFSSEELLYPEGEAYDYQSTDYYFEGWNYISYDEEYDVTDRIIDLKITDAYDSFGNEIYIFLVCPEEDYEEWEPKFLEVLDSIQITLE